MNASYWLTNARLEQGYDMEDGLVSGTKTKVCHIRIKNGTIAEIIGAERDIQSDVAKYDCKKLLMLPSFEEAHIHLDKTYFNRPWKAVRPVSGIFERIEEEKVLLPKLLPMARQQAESILTLIQGYGATHVRTHCNIEPTSGLHRLEATKQALDTFSGKISSEIVAFPQHGLLLSDSVQLVKQSLAEGATHVGGVDPFSVDGNIEKSLQTIVELAVLNNAGIDIHLHDSHDAGKQTLIRLADLTEEARLQGKVTVSHAFWFASAQPQEAEEVAERMGSLGMSVASTVPIGKTTMPLPMLTKNGVTVKLATDSLTDHWSPFGNGDQLEKAGRFAELYGYNDELSLSQAISFITGGIIPLDSKGQQVWPKVGDAASFVLLHASCTAEAIARRAPRQSVWYQGRLVSGSL